MPPHDTKEENEPNARESSFGSMVDRRKALVRDTWKSVENELGQEAVAAFYARLFEKYPEVQPMFSNTNMKAQSAKLYEILCAVVQYLDNVETILLSLKEMGIRHARAYGVKREHYYAVTEVFIEVMTEYLISKIEAQYEGDKDDNELSKRVRYAAVWRMEVAVAWAWAFSLISDAMAGAAQRV